MTTVRRSPTLDQSPARSDQPAIEPVGALFEVPESERQVVGARLHGVRDGLDSIDPGRDVTSPQLRAVVVAIGRLEAAGVPVDVPAVLAELLEAGDVRWPTRSAAAIYLIDLAAEVAIPASAGWHARVVRRATARRRIVEHARAADRLAAGPVDATACDRLRDDLLEVEAAIGRVVA